jgi:hypothetical protein
MAKVKDEEGQGKGFFKGAQEGATAQVIDTW